MKITTETFKKLGYIEAGSLLLLLFIAMPLKYLAGLPDAVRVIGMLHGILFISYALLGAYLLEKLGWSYIKLIIACIIASIPFGPFIFERQLFSEISAK